MAGFTFGNVGELNASVTVQCFVYVVFFIMFFDAFVGVIEYFLQGSQLYHRMIQTIYKELMLMGIVSFIITMILALESYKHTHSEEGMKWIKGIEFAHILLFFLTFFFVAHACLLMRSSIKSRAHYRTTFAMGVDEVIKDAPNMISSPIEFFLFRFHFFPAFGVKERMELWLFHELFRDTYWLPPDFNFADYLSGCFDKYILKAIDRSFFTWITLIILSVLNYARIRLHIGFQTCKRPNEGVTSSSGHRALESVSRLLGSGGGSSSTADAGTTYDKNVCNFQMFRLFLIAGATLMVFDLFMVYIARLYRVRMFSRIGILGTNDYVDFLSFIKKEYDIAKRNRSKFAISSNSAQTTLQLKNDIQAVLDEDEHGEEEGFQELAEGILAAVNRLWEVKDSIVVALRTTWNRVIHGVQARKFNFISPLNEEPEWNKSSESAKSNNNDIAGILKGSGSSHGSIEKLPSSSKLNHLHRSGSRSIAAIEVLSPAASSHSMKNSSSVRPAERTSGEVISLLPVSSSANGPTLTSTATSTSTTASTASTLITAAVTRPPPATTPGFQPNGGRRRASIRVISGPQDSAHRNDIHSFLQTLGVQPEQDVALHHHHHQHPLMTSRSGHIRISSTEEADHGLVPPAASVHANAPTPTNHRRSSILVSNISNNADGLDGKRRRNSEMGRRRNSVHVLPPSDELSLVEKYKLQKAQANPAYALALKELHQKMLADQARMQEADNRTWFVWLKMIVTYPVSCWSTVFEAKKKKNEGGNSDAESKPSVEELKEDARLNEDFRGVFIFGEPTFFIRAIEITIMFNCLYMAFWLSNFITIAQYSSSAHNWDTLNELAMMIPIVVVLPCVTYISETASLLGAISELNLHVIYQVLCDTEDTQNLLHDFRKKLHARVEKIQSHNFDKDEVLQILFEEIDQDGSGVIDMTEFRVLLRHLKLKYSDDRFKRLFHSIAGDGEINFEELKELVDHVGDDESEKNSLNVPAQQRTGNGLHNLDHDNHLNNNSNSNQHNGGSISDASAANGGHSRMTQVELRNKFSRPDRLRPSMMGSNSEISNNSDQPQEKEDKSGDSDGESDGVTDQVDRFSKNEVLYQTRNRTLLNPVKLLSVSSIDYSDTDSDEDPNIDATKKRFSHRKSAHRKHPKSPSHAQDIHPEEEGTCEDTYEVKGEAAKDDLVVENIPDI